MRRLLGALEDYESVIPPDDYVDDSTDGSLYALMEASKEFDESIASMKVMDDILDEIDYSIERLEGVHASIKKYGICRPVMEAVDPKRELVIAGLCCAYEELSNTPQHDDNATTFLKNLDITFEALNDKVTSTLKTVAGKLRDAGQAFVDFTEIYSVSTNNKLKILSSGTGFNEKKFAAKEIRAYKKDDYNKVFAATEHLIRAIRSGILETVETELIADIKEGRFNEDRVKALIKKASDFVKPMIGDKDVEILGMSVAIDEVGKITSVSSKKPSIETVQGTAGELGWRPEDAKKALMGTISLLTQTKSMKDRINKLAGAYGIYDVHAATIFRKNQGNPDNQKLSGLVVNATNNILKVSKMMISICLKTTRSLCSTAGVIGSCACSFRTK